MVCELLTNAFRRRRVFEVAGCAATVEQVLRLAKSADVNVALVPAHLQDGIGRGLDAVRQMRRAASHIRTVCLLESTERSLVVEAFRAGAKGVFCRSDGSFEALCKCILCVHAGQIWATSQQLELTLEALANYRPHPRFDLTREKLLSPQERKVVQLMASGLTNRHIASELGLSQHTVKNYVFRIFEKLGVSTRVELVLFAMHSPHLTEPVKSEVDRIAS
jgi:DNA-binding NarL/FixJ family response regulator